MRSLEISIVMHPGESPRNPEKLQGHPTSTPHFVAQALRFTGLGRFT